MSYARVHEHTHHPKISVKHNSTLRVTCTCMYPANLQNFSSIFQQPKSSCLIVHWSKNNWFGDKTTKRNKKKTLAAPREKTQSPSTGIVQTWRCGGGGAVKSKNSSRFAAVQNSYVFRTQNVRAHVLTKRQSVVDWRKWKAVTSKKREYWRRGTYVLRVWSSTAATQKFTAATVERL